VADLRSPRIGQAGTNLLHHERSAERRHRGTKYGQHEEGHQERDDQLPRSLAVVDRCAHCGLDWQVVYDSSELPVGTGD
jgi:hypothetical protein